MPYKPSRALQLYAPLLRRTVRLTVDTAKSLRQLRKPLVPDRILLAFLGKATDSLRGVLVLQKQGLCHEAQSLARVLFELRLSFDAFSEQLQIDAREASERVMDTVMLEKIKQARASNYAGCDASTPQRLLDTEKKISGRYSPEELKKLKQYGFTGMNVEERAKRSGVSDIYNIAYRNFSRNVHSTDFTELFLQEDPGLISSGRDAHIEERNVVCSELVFVSVVNISLGVNNLAGLGLDRRFQALNIAHQKVTTASRPSTANKLR
jgi:hypothetical protein